MLNAKHTKHFSDSYCSYFPMFVMSRDVNKSKDGLSTKPSQTTVNRANLKTKPFKTMPNPSKPQMTICCTSKPDLFF